MPEVSVVLVAYNEERWIATALASLACQSHPDFEVLVVDDGSTDATASIAARFDVRLLSAPHLGAGAARDRGGRAARGEVLAFLDADDVYDRDFLARLVAPLADPATSGTAPGTIAWHNAAGRLAAGWIAVRGLPRDAPHQPQETHPFPRAVRRADFERVGGYPHAGYGEDAIFGARLPPARVVREARYRATVPDTVREIARASRWIGRGPRFAAEGPPLRRLTPPWSIARALRWLSRGRPTVALVQLLYDAGRLVGSVEARVRPGVRSVA